MATCRIGSNVLAFALVVFLGAASARAELIDWFKFDDGQTNPVSTTAVDSAGHDGTLSNFTLPGAWVTGQVSGALQFNQPNSKVINSFILPTARGTISEWVRPNDLARMAFFYESNGTDSKYNGFGYSDTPDPVLEIHTGLRGDGRFVFYYQDGTGSVAPGNGPGRVDLASNSVFTPSQFNGNTWYHLTVTWDRKAAAKMYINGIIDNTTDISGKTFNGLTPTVSQLGQVGDGSADRAFAGTMDDLAVWNVVLPAASILGLANGTYTPQTAPAPTATHPWQNPIKHLDVNNDGEVFGLDALIIINALNDTGSRVLPDPTNPPDAPPPYYDTSGDDFLGGFDALLVINYLNDLVNGPQMAAVGVQAVPEPSALFLAAMGGCALVVYGRRARRSRSE